MIKRTNKENIIYIVCAVIFISVLVYSGIRALSIYIPQRNASRKIENLKNTVGIRDEKAEDILNTEKSDKVNRADEGLIKLSEINSDFVGWMSIEDTVIDYPVLQSAAEDPEYYLYRDFDKNYSFSGSLFIGEGSDKDSDIFIVYGHNMSADTMFGTLDSYKDAVFAEQHKNIVFRTPSEKRGYRVFAAFQTQVYSEPTEKFEYYRFVGKLGRNAYNEAVENYRNMSLISLNEAPKYP